MAVKRAKDVAELRLPQPAQRVIVFVVVLPRLTHVPAAGDGAVRRDVEDHSLGIDTLGTRTSTRK
jgi:hypothetical protein